MTDPIVLSAILMTQNDYYAKCYKTVPVLLRLGLVPDDDEAPVRLVEEPPGRLRGLEHRRDHGPLAQVLAKAKRRQVRQLHLTPNDPETITLYICFAA